ncbi:hypothetical protein DV515_00013675 [Chloebia gouldiae]|uniref:Uncharacterized protein n=1 Tax=Chloebia gouldiae TaxID=44316 RepID=A0A3L8S192_CHLGU|nr:hypothetical protein DV515_00013675 [Chloebia gouldiae]
MLKAPPVWLSEGPLPTAPLLLSVTATLSRFPLNSGTPHSRRLAQTASLFRGKAAGAGTSHPGSIRMPARLASPSPGSLRAGSAVGGSMEDAEGCFVLQVGEQGGSLGCLLSVQELHDVFASSRKAEIEDISSKTKWLSYSPGLESRLFLMLYPKERGLAVEEQHSERFTKM